MSFIDAPKKARELVIGFFSALPRAAIRHPGRVICAAGLLTVLAGLGIGRLKLRTDAQALVSPDAPEVRYDRAIRAKFGIEDQIVVLVRS